MPAGPSKGSRVDLQLLHLHSAVGPRISQFAFPNVDLPQHSATTQQRRQHSKANCRVNNKVDTARNMNRVALHRALLSPALRRPLLFTTPLASALATQIRRRPLSSVTETSFWKSLVPRPLRTAAGQRKKTKVQKGWNPATFFIFIFLLIGSMSIQMISLKKDFATFMRQSDVRIGLLREVVEKLQRGEEVDVEKVLGTGDPERELAWEEGR